MRLLTIIKLSCWVWWYMPVVSASLEGEVGGSGCKTSPGKTSDNPIRKKF
jgi:hypothetical protein